MSDKIEFIVLSVAGAEVVDYVLGPGASVFSGEIPLDSFNPSGLFSLFAHVEGDGQLTVLPYLSLSGQAAEYAASIDYAPVSDFGSASGADGDGKVLAPVVLSVCRRVKFKLTNPHADKSITIKRLVFGWQ